jgi:RNA polymerase sigma factor (sigma-70 family)
MNTDEIIQYYDDLMRLAVSKCGSQTDAEDLVGDTMLAAFSYINKGGRIEHPKTWLANTLCHKYNDSLRKKYRAPTTVNFEDSFEIPAEEEEYFSSEDAAKIRKELNHIAYVNREVLIRYYFGRQSVSDIAAGLGIPEGTVKSRLATGRSQMKKGLETMETRENYLPGKLYLSFGGSDGPNMEPISLVENDLIAQNLLILAYEKPITVSDLSKAIGIPTAYIEPIIKKLVDGELMAETASGKVYADFLITKPQDRLKNFKPQLDFVDRHFDTIWNIIAKMSAEISGFGFVSALESKQKTELDRYAVLKALQDFQHCGTGKIEAPHFPKRRDGGWWFAQATAFDAGYNTKEYNEASEYAIQGGHRTSESFVDDGTRSVRLYEFDTTLWDSPHRYGGAFDLYFKYIIPLLWRLYTDKTIDDSSEIPNEFISYIPSLERFGMLGNTQGELRVAIPVLKKTEYEKVNAAIKCATESLKTAIGEDFSAFVSSNKTSVPKHLTSVPDLFRYGDATNYFAMTVVRKAYENGLHMKNVDYCCPPVVLVYDEAENKN